MSTATLGARAALDVSWSAEDSTGAGIQDYDVEYAVDEGAWTGWFTETQALSGTLAGQAGHAYSFRVRATDHVSNTGAWAQTTVTTTLTRKYYYLAGGAFLFWGRRSQPPSSGAFYGPAMDVQQCKATAPETGAWSDGKLAPKVKCARQNRKLALDPGL